MEEKGNGNGNGKPEEVTKIIPHNLKKDIYNSPLTTQEYELIALLNSYRKKVVEKQTEYLKERKIYEQRAIEDIQEKIRNKTYPNNYEINLNTIFGDLNNENEISSYYTFIEIHNGISCTPIPGNQFNTSTNTKRACTPIAFVAAFQMSEYMSYKSLFASMDWGHVLSLGGKIWSLHESLSMRTKTDYERKFMTLEDIKRELPHLSTTFSELWNNVIELGGSIKDEVNACVNPIDCGTPIGVNLRDAIDNIHRKDKSTTAVISAGSIKGANISLALWCGPSADYIIYDSHGGVYKGCSALYYAKDMKSVLWLLNHLFKSIPTEKTEPTETGVYNSAYYSIYIFQYNLSLNRKRKRTTK